MRTYLKIVIRNLLNNPTFGFVTIAGFAFSIAIALLLSAYIFNEFTYDKSFANREQIYRLCTEKGITTFKGELTDELKNKYPEIENICRYENGPIKIVYEKSPFSIDYLVKTDNAFFKMFSIQLRLGNPEIPTPDKNSIAISSTLAKTIFGDLNPIGQLLNIQYRKDYKITAVFEDFPEKSSIRAQIIMPWETVYDLGGEWRGGDFYSRVFLQLNEKSDHELLSQKITKDYSEDHFMKQPFTLLSFSKSYTSPLTLGRTSATLHADLNSILLFSVVTLLILVISILNFVILVTSNHMSRLKEIGIKKATGASRIEIFKQFIFESVTVSLISFVIGILLANFFKASFTSLIEKDFGLSGIFQFQNFVFIVLGILIIGILAGFYPAIVISKYKPVSIFSNSAKKGSLTIKSGLSVLQYLISIVLIVSLIVMTRQNALLSNKDLGFTKEQLINISIPIEMKDKLPVIKEKLLQNPSIKSCAVSHGIPGKISLMGFWSEGREKFGYEGNLPYFTVDADFFNVYNAEFIEGRGFLESDWEKSVIINETAFKLTGWKSIEGQVITGIPTPEQAFGKDPEAAKNNTLKVVGVIKDINVEKLNQPVAPTIFECSDHFGISYLTCSVLPGNYPSVINNIKNVWEEISPEYVFDYQFYDEWLNTLYKEEQHAAYVIRIFAILSIILTCLGTFGVIHFVTRQRVKEVGIRKVNGAKIYEVVKILNWEMIKWIALAFVLAVPFSWFIMHKWLENFAYKTNLSWWIFALAGALALGIALLTVSWQSWRAATRNPVEALRYE